MKKIEMITDAFRGFLQPIRRFPKPGGRSDTEGFIETEDSNLHTEITINQSSQFHLKISEDNRGIIFHRNYVDLKVSESNLNQN